MARVTIIDYGIGNLLSVARAFEHCGAEAVVTGSPDKIETAERLVLPGVGAFADGMAGLRDRGLIDPIKKFAARNRPFLGICLGMQLMFDSGEEYGIQEGLGLIPGEVVAIPTTGTDGTPHKIPHIGWKSLELPASAPKWTHTILDGIRQHAAVYFVHSFTAFPVNPDHRLADCHYDGRLISAAIRSGTLYGCQFHPEKSGEVGLGIIRNFIKLV